MDSFVFYRSFHEAAMAFPEELRLDFYDYLFECCFEDLPLDAVPFPYQPVIIQMLASVTSAKERHDKAIEDGAKGGRPRYIPPEEWKAYRQEHTQKETAEHFGISVDTLQRWEKAAKTAKPQNLNVNVNDNVNDNANVNVNDIISNNKNTGSNKGTSKVPVLPELGEGERWISEPYKMRNGTWIADYENLDGEVRCKVLGEP